MSNNPHVESEDSAYFRAQVASLLAEGTPAAERRAYALGALVELTGAERGPSLLSGKGGHTKGLAFVPGTYGTGPALENDVETAGRAGTDYQRWNGHRGAAPERPTLPTKSVPDGIARYLGAGRDGVTLAVVGFVRAGSTDMVGVDDVNLAAGPEWLPVLAAVQAPSNATDQAPRRREREGHRVEAKLTRDVPTQTAPPAGEPAADAVPAL
jgi:hypothetical protein